ncbi:mannose PTS, EIIA [Lactobacillus selangorensis]|uniref:Mannose PTS, EIIA n=1 Tax=Lactobacillus selangorensis TaxID=81857 RepID=A0A0R2FHD9_9LACO|nr:PTS sugar transporter subunit IIA [Lactobacillus selangorensis]KRN27952.1 mannose PTS, EIIA [Lactobacillus selangorensis]KRN30577.1 mannose PTS, EIIA [Lactobacillus selangorensis]
MLAIILASHGRFAASIQESAEMIYGKIQPIQAVNFMPEEHPADLLAKYQAALASFPPEADVLFIVDLWGGSPFTVARRLVEQAPDRMALVTGLNLPMLIEAYFVRDQPLEQVVAEVEKAARKGVGHLETQKNNGDDE